MDSIGDMVTHYIEGNGEHIATLTAQIRRNRATINRRRNSLQQAMEHQKRFIREALDQGMPPKKIARLSGLTEGRISQIRNEGGPPVSMFDLM
jgi:hypothetical protein